MSMTAGYEDSQLADVSDGEKTHFRILETSAVLLFTLQALRTLVAMLFARVYDAVFDGEAYGPLALAGALVVGIVAAPLLSPRDNRRLAHSLRVSAVACALARVVLSFDSPSLRLVFAAATLACAAYYLTGVLRLNPGIVALGLGLAVFSDQVLRAIGHTYDPSLRPWWVPVQLLLAVAMLPLTSAAARAVAKERASPGPGFEAALAFGCALFLLTSLFGLPNAAARWTGAGYAPMVACMLALSSLPLWPRIARWYRDGMLAGGRYSRLVAGTLMLVGLALGYLSRAGVSAIAMVEAIAAFWLLIPQSLQSGTKGLRLGMSAGLAMTLVLSTTHALAFTYAYTSPLFRGAGLPTFLVAGLLCVVFPVVRRRPCHVLLPTFPKPKLVVGVLAGLWLLALVWALPSRQRVLATVDTVRLATYNIHYGFDTDWHLSLVEQAETIADSGADIVALQEVDTGRLTSYGVDHALWLSRRLGMRAVYLPTVEHTTGIALLSRLAIDESRSTLLPSTGEPTGLVGITIQVDGEPLRAHGVWLGLSPDERERQLRAALTFIGEGRATLAGDLNATPQEAPYAMMREAGFVDPFATGDAVAPPTDPAVNPQKRIDYVWLRGLTPGEATVSESVASDHRLVVVEGR